MAALFNNVGCLRRAHITGLVGFCCLRLLMCAGGLSSFAFLHALCSICRRQTSSLWCCIRFVGSLVLLHFFDSHGSCILARFGASVHAADDMRSLVVCVLQLSPKIGCSVVEDPTSVVRCIILPHAVPS